MGTVLLNIKSGDKVYIECSDINTDITEYIEKNKKDGFSEKNMVVLIENNDSAEESDLMLSLDEFFEAKKKIEFLTSHVKEDDSEEEKFAKIVTSLHKHIKYAYTKTGDRNVGKSQNFIDGLTKGRCVCVGMAQILREALLMHGIDCDIVESINNNNDSGHQWNKVLLGKNWYNWDQTNIKSNILSLNSIGKNLQTDAQMGKKKIYQYYTGEIICGIPPSEELIKKINFYARKNKHKYPRDNAISKIFGRFKKEDKIALPQALDESETENLQIGDIEIIEQEKIVPFIYKNIDLWKIKTCNTKDVSKTIRTFYMGLDFQDDIEKLTKNYSGEFWKVFYILMGSAKKNYAYLGNILRNSNFENKGLMGITPISKKNRKIIEVVNDAIADDMEEERDRINALANMKRSRDTKTH